jgi:GTPase involved in cell partitioning and DNA repair
LDPDEGDLMTRYEVINQELAAYNADLTNKPTMIILTKSDLVDSNQVAAAIKLFSNTGSLVISSTILSEENSQDLLEASLAIIKKERQITHDQTVLPKIKTYTLEDLPQRFTRRR